MRSRLTVIALAAAAFGLAPAAAAHAAAPGLVSGFPDGPTRVAGSARVVSAQLNLMRDMRGRESHWSSVQVTVRAACPVTPQVHVTMRDARTAVVSASVEASARSCGRPVTRTVWVPASLPATTRSVLTGAGTAVPLRILLAIP